MSLLNEISQSELQHMRESGMSNREIANALDISYQTVLRFIGKQPTDLRRPAHRKAKPVTHPETIPEIKESDLRQDAPQVKTQEECLAILDRSVSLVGDVAEYRIDCADNVLTISIQDKSVCISLSSIDSLLKEVKTIQNHIPDLKITNEMW